MAGLLTVVIFAVAALAVDLSNSFERGVYVQGQADFAALAGANDLPGTKSVGDPAVQAVADYLNENATKDDAPTAPVTAPDLIDGSDVNGEVYFDSPSRIRVVAPEAQVNFTAAKALGVDNVNVQAEATVGIFSPGTGPMPVYAVSGCDYGPQTFVDPAGGHVVSVTRPPMENDTEPPAFNNAQLDTLTTLPTPVSVGANGVQLTIDGARYNSGAASVVQVGFFRDKTGPLPHMSTPVVPTTRTANQLVATIPGEVTAVEGVWWVRVYKGNSASDGSWSPPSEALPLRVGQAVLECGSGSSDGNFGTVFLPRTDVSSQDDMIAKNMAAALEFDLAVMPTGGPAPTCTGSGSPAVHAPDDGTNCVDTKTGMPANAATQGLVTGIDGEPGRLDQDTSDRCQDSSFGGRPTRRPSGISGYSINDDILTCFFTNNSTTIEDISKEGAAYTSGVVLDPAIYSSPRFTWVPVLHEEPTSGGSQKYSIKEFRPAFITDQPLGANATNHSEDGATTANGLHVELPAGTRVSRIKVVFFNEDALPTNAGGAPVTDWMGFGPKILRLVD
jgi:hypothetical protein